MDEAVSLPARWGESSRTLSSSRFLYEKSATAPHREISLPCVKVSSKEWLRNQTSVAAGFCPADRHPTAGTVAGWCHALVAYNINLSTDNLGAIATKIARNIRHQRWSALYQGDGVELKSGTLPKCPSI